MRYLYWVVLTPLFLLLVAFALRNSDHVTVRFFLGREWHAPLALVLLVFFCAGVMLALIAVIPAFYRQRRQFARQGQLPVDDAVPAEAGKP
ncbi:MAG: LapA family protein [Betaproteobacteria bacterium]|nr:LapA family protein [Betaproteobacteria bacterium]